MLKEFKAFIMRGNVLDLAVAVILAAAFGKIITSLVNDVIMPVVGLVLGGINFDNLTTTIGTVVINWGAFLQATVDFIIVAFIVFLIVKAANNMKKAPAPAAPAEPTTKECPHCFSTISIKATRCPPCTSELK